MAAPDDTTEPRSSDTLPVGSDGERPPRQRIAGTWNRLAPVAGKAGVILISGVTAAAVKGFAARSSTQAAATAVEEDTTPLTRRWSNNSGGYYVCSHQGCQKKVNPTIFGHDCCGRCGAGRNCLSAAQRDYDGPGSLAHNCHEGLLPPGVCTVCGEPPEAHLWVFDFITGERRFIR